MKVATYIAAVVLVVAASPFAQAAENYQLDKGHTAVIFGISHLRLSYTYGRFNEVSGSYVLDRQNMAASTFRLDINANSVDTNSEGRDQHLRGPDFFNASQFPVISFESTSVMPTTVEGKTILKVEGNLTMHGVTKPVAFDLRLLGEGPGPSGAFRTGFHTELKLKRSEYGMTGMIPNIGDEVAITISFEGIRQRGGASIQRRTKAIPVSRKLSARFVGKPSRR